MEGPGLAGHISCNSWFGIISPVETSCAEVNWYK